MRSAQGLEEMSASDIQKKLDSGSFMTSATRSALTDRLQLLTENDISDRLHFVAKKKEDICVTKNKSVHLDQEMFPDFITTSVNETKNNIDFTKFVEEGDGPSEQVVKSININYSDITNMISSAALLRIKTYYRELGHRIKILDTIRLLRHRDMQNIHKHFKYEELVQHERRLNECICSCEKMEIILASLRKIHKAGNFSTTDLAQKKIFVSYVKEALLNYETELCCIERDIDSIVGNPDAAVIENCIVKVQSVLKKFIRENDPQINCEYYVALHNTVATPTDYTLVLTGISKYCYEDINFGPNFYDVSDKFLQHVTIDQLEKLFDRKYASDWDDYFVLCHSDSKIRINYTIGDKQMIRTGDLNIRDLPADVKVFSTLVFNVSNDSVYLPRNEKKYISNWHYQQNDGVQNKDFVNAVFDELMTNDKHGILKPHMQKSFRVLASKTSRA